MTKSYNGNISWGMVRDRYRTPAITTTETLMETSSAQSGGHPLRRENKPVCKDIKKQKNRAQNVKSYDQYVRGVRPE